MRTPDWLTNAPIAHRGLHDGNRQVGENTLDAFADAVARGFPIELDVHVTRAGHAVVHHDPTLLRTCGSGQPVDTLTDSDLARVRTHTGQTIPTLAQTLELVAGRVPVIVELKRQPRGLGRTLAVAVAAHLDRYPHRDIAISSFDPRLVAWFTLRRRRTVRGLNAALDMPNPLLQAVSDRAVARPALSPDFVGYNVARLPAAAARNIQERGIPLIAYTVRDDADWSTARRCADGMFFELPGLSAAPSRTDWRAPRK